MLAVPAATAVLVVRSDDSPPSATIEFVEPPPRPIPPDGALVRTEVASGEERVTHQWVEAPAEGGVVRLALRGMPEGARVTNLQVGTDQRPLVAAPRELGASRTYLVSVRPDETYLHLQYEVEGAANQIIVGGLAADVDGPVLHTRVQVRGAVRGLTCTTPAGETQQCGALNGNGWWSMLLPPTREGELVVAKPDRG